MKTKKKSSVQCGYQGIPFSKMISIAKFKSRAFLFLPDWTRSSWITNPPLSLRRPRPERDRRNRKAEGSSSGTSPFCWLVVVLYHLDMVARIKTWTSIGTVPNLSLVQWRFCKWFVQDSSLQIAVLCTRREGPRLRVRRLLCWERERELRIITGELSEWDGECSVWARTLLTSRLLSSHLWA